MVARTPSRNIYYVYSSDLNEVFKRQVDVLWKDLSAKTPYVPGTFDTIQYSKVVDLTISGKKAIGYQEIIVKKNWKSSEGQYQTDEFIHYIFVDGNSQFILSIDETILSKATVKKLRDGFGTPNAPAGYTPAESNWATYTESGLFTAEYPDEWKNTKTNTIKGDGTGAYDLKFTDKNGKNIYSVNMVALNASSPKTTNQWWQTMSASNTKLYDVTIAGYQTIGYAKNIPDDYIYYIFVDSNSKFILSIDETILSKATVKKLRDGFGTPNAPAGYTPAESNWATYTESGLFTAEYPDEWKATQSDSFKGDGSGQYVLDFASNGTKLYTIKMVFAFGDAGTVEQLWKILDATGKYTKISDLTLGGQQTIVYTDKPAGDYTYYIFTKGNLNYELKINTAKVSEAIKDEILKGLQFI